MDAQLNAAQQLLLRFLDPAEDREALFRSLRPDPAQYDALFTDSALAAKLRQYSERLWAEPSPIVPADPAQTEVLVYGATVEELKEQDDPGLEFPGGYKRVAPLMTPGLRLFAFKFVKPGHTMGTLFDGLYPLDEGWAFIPKPWRGL